MDNMLNGNVPFEFSSEPVGGWNGKNEWRGFGIFNQGNVAAEDFERQQQSANNQFYRDLWLQQNANEWESREAEKSYQRTLEMDSTKYQRTIADMKKAGINPIMLMGHSVDSPISPTASASSARSGGSNFQSSGNGGAQVVAGVAKGLLNIIAGLITKGSSKSFHVGFGDK